MKKRIAVINYGYGNLHSLINALNKIAEPLNIEINLTSDIKLIKQCDKIILPGVGAFQNCMQGLNKYPRLKQVICEEILERKKYFLGICVGMQMLARSSEEFGDCKGLGWLEADVVAIKQKNNLKIPHMGWNELNIRKEHPIFKKINNKEEVYFVHSYHMKFADEITTDKYVYADTEYGDNLTAVVIKDNIIGVQFHPEKSQKPGLQILENFLMLN